MSAQLESLLVELYLSNAYVSGVLPRVPLDQGRRLADLLVGGDGAVRLAPARLKLLAGAVELKQQSLAVMKDEILLALPHETPDQLRNRAFFRTGIGTRAAESTAVAFLIPPFLVSGRTNVALGVTDVKGSSYLHLDLTKFDRFIPVTEAALTLADGTQRSEPFLLVNRDKVSAYGKLASDSAASAPSDRASGEIEAAQPTPTAKQGFASAA